MLILSSKIGSGILTGIGVIVFIIGCVGFVLSFGIVNVSDEQKLIDSMLENPSGSASALDRDTTTTSFFIVLVIGITMLIIGRKISSRIDTKRSTLPDISSHLKSGERVSSAWPLEGKKGFMRKKFLMFTLTNQRILVINTDNKKIENAIDLAGVTAIAKNRHSETRTYGGGGSVDSYGHITSYGGTSTTTFYGDIDLFKGQNVIYSITHMPDADAVVENIRQVQGMLSVATLSGATAPAEKLPGDITKIQHMILKSFQQGHKKSKDIAKLLFMDKKEIEKEIDALKNNAYVTKNNKLTGKAIELLGL